MTNVTPRRRKRLNDGDTDDAEVLWDFGSASPRSRLDLCKEYDRIYHAANQELRQRLTTWFPETMAEASSESPQRKLVYDARIQPVVDSPVSSRHRRATERQRRKDKALRELQAFAHEIKQSNARVSASPVLQHSPASRRTEGLRSAASHKEDDKVPCQLFTSVAVGDDDVLKEFSENVEDIFKLSQDELEQIIAVEDMPQGFALSEDSSRCHTMKNPVTTVNATKDVAAASCTTTIQTRRSSGCSKTSSLLSSKSQRACASAATSTTTVRPKVLQAAPLCQPGSSAAALRTSHHTRAARADTRLATNQPNDVPVLCSQQQPKCTQAEIERKRRLAKQKLLKRNFSSSSHVSASDSTSRR